ncbi:hypothetical protein NDU88_004287 [Pleurodeles waltl]|uniref:Uncharacterized protein n=1 Tax=Pleurodeles waltl TaxID=8319 RepID=A0AAV7LU73_PLEWA|nr:hypothetical protein NDU88_004287 [Pleurodeles waltl]
MQGVGGQPIQTYDGADNKLERRVSCRSSLFFQYGARVVLQVNSCEVGVMHDQPGFFIKLTLSGSKRKKSAVFKK